MAAFFYHFFLMSLIALASVSVFAIVVYRLGFFSDEESGTAISRMSKSRSADSDASHSVAEDSKSNRRASREEEFEVPSPSIPVFSRSEDFSSELPEDTDGVRSEENTDFGFHVVAAASVGPNVSFPTRRINYRRARAVMGNVVVKGLELDYRSFANAVTTIQAASQYDRASALGLRPAVTFNTGRPAQRSAIDVGGVILFAGDEENFTYGFDGDSSNATTKSIANVNSFGVA